MAPYIPVDLGLYRQTLCRVIIPGAYTKVSMGSFRRRANTYQCHW